MLDKQLAGNQAYINKLISLKYHIDDDHETAYNFTDPSDASTYTTQRSGPNTLTMVISVSGQIAGTMHNHPDGATNPDGSINYPDPMPSVDDLAALYTLYTNSNMSNPSTFSLAVLTAYKNAWLLQITNIGQFITWGANNLATAAQQTALKNSINTSYNNYYNNQFKNFQDSHELAVLDNIVGSGLSLSKGDYVNLNSWVPQSSSAGTIISSPCN